jgi:hypothetical protein
MMLRNRFVPSPPVPPPPPTNAEIQPADEGEPLVYGNPLFGSPSAHIVNQGESPTPAAQSPTPSILGSIGNAIYSMLGGRSSPPSQPTTDSPTGLTPHVPPSTPTGYAPPPNPPTVASNRAPLPTSPPSSPVAPRGASPVSPPSPVINLVSSEARPSSQEPTTPRVALSFSTPATSPRSQIQALAAMQEEQGRRIDELTNIMTAQLEVASKMERTLEDTITQAREELNTQASKVNEGLDAARIELRTTVERACYDLVNQVQGARQGVAPFQHESPPDIPSFPPATCNPMDIDGGSVSFAGDPVYAQRSFLGGPTRSRGFTATMGPMAPERSVLPAGARVTLEMKAKWPPRVLWNVAVATKFNGEGAVDFQMMKALTMWMKEVKVKAASAVTVSFTQGLDPACAEEVIFHRTKWAKEQLEGEARKIVDCKEQSEGEFHSPEAIVDFLHEHYFPPHIWRRVLKAKLDFTPTPTTPNGVAEFLHDVLLAQELLVGKPSGSWEDKLWEDHTQTIVGLCEGTTLGVDLRNKLWDLQSTTRAWRSIYDQVAERMKLIVAATHTQPTRGLGAAPASAFNRASEVRTPTLNAMMGAPPPLPTPIQTPTGPCGTPRAGTQDRRYTYEGEDYSSKTLSESGLSIDQAMRIPWRYRPFTDRHPKTKAERRWRAGAKLADKMGGYRLDETDPTILKRLGITPSEDIMCVGDHIQAGRMCLACMDPDHKANQCPHTKRAINA